MKPRSFDRLASCYRALEFLAFGRDLERARFTLLPHLHDCRRILILGEGDGRFLEQLLRLNPSAQIDCLDLSAAMLARAQQRVAGQSAQVTFRQADIRTADLPARQYDAVVTCFFLDCFDVETCAAVVAKIVAALKPDARWFWSDFNLPARGIARWRAQIWLATLYFFFRWQTGLKTSALPPAEALIAAHGFRAIASASWQWDLLRSRCYALTPNAAATLCNEPPSRPESPRSPAP